MKKIFVILLVVFGCEKLKPESVNIPDYPDLEQVFNDQVKKLDTASLKKSVWLDGKEENKTLVMDTVLWKKELSFLKEINPNTPEYVGAFEKSENEIRTQLTLMSTEKGKLKVLSYALEGINYSTIKATIHEEKEVYSHHREIDVQFENGLLTSYQISGFQKIVLKDTIEFRIRGQVINPSPAASSQQ